MTRLSLPRSLSSSTDVYCIRREIATEFGFVIAGATPRRLAAVKMGIEAEKYG